MNNQPTVSRLEQTPSLVRVASDELLLLGARLHDDVALGVLYDRYGAEVYGMAFAMLHQPEPAEAVMQDVFLRCWRGLELYDAVKGSTHDWLMGVTRRRAQDAVNALDALGERETVILSLESATRRNDVGLIAPPAPSGARERLLARARAESNGLRHSNVPSVLIPDAEVMPGIVDEAGETEEISTATNVHAEEALQEGAHGEVQQTASSERPTLTAMPILGPTADEAAPPAPAPTEPGPTESVQAEAHCGEAAEPDTLPTSRREPKRHDPRKDTSWLFGPPPVVPLPFGKHAEPAATGETAAPEPAAPERSLADGRARESDELAMDDPATVEVPSMGSASVVEPPTERDAEMAPVGEALAPIEADAAPIAPVTAYANAQAADAEMVALGETGGTAFAPVADASAVADSPRVSDETEATNRADVGEPETVETPTLAAEPATVDDAGRPAIAAADAHESDEGDLATERPTADVAALSDDGASADVGAPTGDGSALHAAAASGASTTDDADAEALTGAAEALPDEQPTVVAAALDADSPTVEAVALDADHVTVEAPAAPDDRETAQTVVVGEVVDDSEAETVDIPPRPRPAAPDAISVPSLVAGSNGGQAADAAASTPPPEPSEVPMSEALAAALAPIPSRRPARQQRPAQPVAATVGTGAAAPPRRRVKMISVFWAAALLFVITLGIAVAAWSATGPHLSPDVSLLSRLPGGRVITMRGMGAPNAIARLHVVDNGRRGELSVEGMPVLPAGRVYQLWLMEAGQPVRNAGAFFVNRRGDAVVTVSGGVSLDRLESILLTQEQAPGTTAPSGPRLLQWTP